MERKEVLNYGEGFLHDDLDDNGMEFEDNMPEEYLMSYE